MSSHTYLVTGAAGFIGANYVHYVRQIEPDARIVVVDNLSFGSNIHNLDEVRDHITFIPADIADHAAMSDIYQRCRPDFLVNFAAESHNDRAIIDPSAFMRSNALGAQVLLECSREFPVRSHLHVSTIEVYGELGDGDAHFTESSPLNAKTPYSAAKAAGDQIVRAYMHTYPSMNIRMTHCANNYGAYQLPEKLLALAITNVLRGRKVPLYGDGQQRRDWLHVLDHCRGIHAALHADVAFDREAAATDPSHLPIFDLSARTELTNYAVVSAALRELNVDPTEWIEYVPDRPNHDKRYLIDPAKAETALGWKPTIPFADGIAETVRWYRDNTDWWEQVIEVKGELAFDWGADRQLLVDSMWGALGDRRVQGFQAV